MSWFTYILLNKNVYNSTDTSVPGFNNIYLPYNPSIVVGWLYAWRRTNADLNDLVIYVRIKLYTALYPATRLYRLHSSLMSYGISVVQYYFYYKILFIYYELWHIVMLLVVMLWWKTVDENHHVYDNHYKDRVSLIFFLQLLIARRPGASFQLFYCWC